MRAISSFNREAGISTFWCRAWSAFRTLVSISATGSVNLIVCFSLSHPFAPPFAENLQRLVPRSCYCCSSRDRYRWLRRFAENDTLIAILAFLRGSRLRLLPRRLRNPWNLPAQRQLPEAQAANAELAQKSARTAAELAAVVFARGKLGLSCVLNSFCCSRHSILRFDSLKL